MVRSQRKTAPVLDWAVAQAKAYAILLRSGGSPAHAKMPLDSYWTEPLQNAVARALSKAKQGKEPLPATTIELAENLARYARFIDDNRRARARFRMWLEETHSDKLVSNFQSLDEQRRDIDLFDRIARNDTIEKLVAHAYDALDDDGKALLTVWLGDGIELEDTAALMDALGIEDEAEFVNLKRRVKYRIRQTLMWLDADQGGSK